MYTAFIILDLIVLDRLLLYFSSKVWIYSGLLYFRSVLALVSRQVGLSSFPRFKFIAL